MTKLVDEKWSPTTFTVACLHTVKAEIGDGDDPDMLVLVVTPEETGPIELKLHAGDVRYLHHAIGLTSRVWQIEDPA